MNTGLTIENLYKLEIKLHISIYQSPITPNLWLDNQQRREGNNMIFSFSNSSPIFPNDQVKMCSLHVAAKSETIKFLDEFPVELKLFFSGGVDTKEIQLSRILKHNNISLLESKMFR